MQNPDVGPGASKRNLDGKCVSCGVDAGAEDLDEVAFSCSNCNTEFYQCEFCNEVIGTNLYECPNCDHTSLLPRTRLRLLSLPGVDHLCYALSAAKLRRAGRGDSTVSEMLETTEQFRGYGLYRLVKTMQKESEFVPFVETVGEADPKTVLEIGTCRGGTLYFWCRYLDAELAVSLDYPGGLFGGGYPERKVKFFGSFCDDTDLECVRRDSHDPRTVDAVRDALDGREVDFLFIDGDHTYEGVKQDFEMYSPLVADGGIVAFHDTEHRMNDDPDSFYGVKRYWQEIEGRYETEEFVADGEHRYGIGMVRMP